MKAYPIATSVKDASGAPASIHPATNMATCMDDSSGRAASACDVEAMIGCVVLAKGTPDMPSSACSAVGTVVVYASPVDAVATPTLLTLTTDTAPASS